MKNAFKVGTIIRAMSYKEFRVLEALNECQIFKGSYADFAKRLGFKEVRNILLKMEADNIVSIVKRHDIGNESTYNPMISVRLMENWEEELIASRYV